MSDKKKFKNSIRTILTKAVCGRALQTCQTTVYITPGTMWNQIMF